MIRGTSMAVSLIASLTVCFLAAAIGASASLQAGSFYADLVRPDWAPPGSVFGPVWTVLYAMMAVAAWLIWPSRRTALARIALLLFALQLLANTAWSWLFFGWKQGALSFLDIVLLWVLVASTLALFWRIRRLAGLLLVPYLVWVSFAAMLNFSVWQLNPSALG